MQQALLTVVEEDTQPMAGSRLDVSQRGLGKVLGTSGFGSGQVPVKVCFEARLASAECTFVFWLGSAYRTTHRQALCQ